MAHHARGTFEITVSPQPTQDGVGDPSVGRMAIHKQFHGDLEGTGNGQMLAVGTPVDGSAGYVAMERVTGTVHGRQGSFALQHTGTLTRGAPQLSVSIVPDSGTEGLSGITGQLEIIIANGVHGYHLEYSLPDVP
jgi:flagellar basal body rod protein FlgG